jgi:hypothetical protein
VTLPAAANDDVYYNSCYTSLMPCGLVSTLSMVMNFPYSRVGADLITITTILFFSSTEVN